MNSYPLLTPDNQEDAIELLRVISRERPNDIKDFDNLTNTFMSGRKSGKVPTGSADISVTDRVGDFNYTPSFFYIVVNNAGTAQWRRIALGSW